MDTIIGLDIGGTKTTILTGTQGGEILSRFQFPTQAEIPFKNRAEEFRNQISGVAREAMGAGRSIGAISVSIGGPLRISEGVLQDPAHLPGWHDLGLKEWLEIQFPGVPVFVEHDGNAGALAEYYFGAGSTIPDLRHMVFLTFGTGLGAGIIVNGEILHGATDTAGEIGHWRMADDGPVSFGKAGSWEAFASGAGFLALAESTYPGEWSASTTVSEFIEAYLSGNNHAADVVAQSAEVMGQGIAKLVDAFNPQLVVLGTLARVLGDAYLDPVREVVRREALPSAAAACRIEAAHLGDQLGDVAALMAAIVAMGDSRHTGRKRSKKRRR